MQFESLLTQIAEYIQANDNRVKELTWSFDQAFYQLKIEISTHSDELNSGFKSKHIISYEAITQMPLELLAKDLSSQLCYGLDGYWKAKLITGEIFTIREIEKQIIERKRELIKNLNHLPMFLASGGSPDFKDDRLEILTEALESSRKKTYAVPNPGSYTAPAFGFNGNTVVGELKKLLPSLEAWTKCPQCKDNKKLKNQIIHLNDGHKWTREAIADWLESLDLDIEFKEPAQ